MSGELNKKNSRIQGVKNSRSDGVAEWAAAFRPVDRDPIGVPCDEQWIWRQYFVRAHRYSPPELLTP